MDGLNGTFRTVVGTVYVHGVSTEVLHAEFWYETLRDPAIFVVYAVFEVESWPTTEPKHQSSTTAKTSIVGSRATSPPPTAGISPGDPSPCF